uniref:Uncharacterized protein n=1 Tax=Rhizophora mucronata TaxID=61149 RepID=A0A2P2JNZ9_RHIMU
MMDEIQISMKKQSQVLIHIEELNCCNTPIFTTTYCLLILLFFFYWFTIFPSMFQP